MEFEVFIKEGPGINTCGRERKKQEWVEGKLGCGAGPAPWASGAHVPLRGVLSRAEGPGRGGGKLGPQRRLEGTGPRAAAGPSAGV